MRIHQTGVRLLTCAATGLALACGSAGAPASNATSTTTTSTSSATITITSAGISPTSVEIALGTRALFINNDTRSHTMTSDPHPEHTDCPPINSVGFLAPGRSLETGNFTTARTCGFHDHDDPTNTKLQGKIVIK